MNERILTVCPKKRQTSRTPIGKRRLTRIECVLEGNANTLKARKMDHTFRSDHAQCNACASSRGSVGKITHVELAWLLEGVVVWMEDRACVSQATQMKYNPRNGKSRGLTVV